MNFASATEYLLYFTATGLQFVERFANKEGAGILANARPQMVKGAFGPPKETVRELPVSIRAVILVSLILASTMAFFNSVAVDEEEELINDVTETETVRLEALLHTFAK
ncbi:hypothetical protein D917_08645 [Trichinella nativa]|uniref:Uncharacterized protein n=1 Tax=Trichinella nativa TaxID=6335 RepID=A0A1Y3EJ17_9BILA|nr:hypothetical protein D917_08645 [Trichinella nativa]